MTMVSDEACDSLSAAPLRDRRPDALGNLRVLPDEILCSILVYLPPRDVASLSCVSSVMYILCNEEPLWMSLCLNNINRPIQYKGSWKITTLHQLDLPFGHETCREKQLHFDGFNSLFLYRRFYRCYTNLGDFSFDNGNVDRKKDLSLVAFHNEYDGKKPVLISGLADSWPAKHSWTVEQLLQRHGDTTFRISQRSSKKISMKFKDYVSYMQLQHDEDPLYVFDDKFGEAAPGLLEDYSVPHLFQEDLFDVLERDKRPPFRWLIIGPERSGASWHVDPALTSAWNTLLSGRKRWALYPPGRVPLGVTVHIDEEDGDVNIETPSSLQWWLDFYPLLADEDKLIVCTQLPGETIFVPSGWWHCVLNIEPTVAVTQNFVNSINFEHVCLDMAPGYRHKGLCRAGLLAVDKDILEEVGRIRSHTEDGSYSDLTRKEKRVRVSSPVADRGCEDAMHSFGISTCHQKFSYEINFLAMFLENERDHFNSLWCSSNCIGQRGLREWLWKLWVGKPGLRDLLWKGACLALNAGKWSQNLERICAFHGLPSPTDEEKLPVGTGSNPVYLVADSVIKIFVEGGLEDSLHCLGTELQFYNLLHKVESPLKKYVPAVLASGILFLEGGSYKVMPWDGRGVPEVIISSPEFLKICNGADYQFGIWSKKLLDYRKSGIQSHESINSSGCSEVWPYIVMKRCKGKIFSDLRETLEWDEMLNLASFLGKQLRNLHCLPCPPFPHSAFQVLRDNGFKEDITDKIGIPTEWEVFTRTLNRQKKTFYSRLTKWNDPIPNTLIDKVGLYLPDDFAKLFTLFEDHNRCQEECNSYTWIHSDIMDDNIHMEQIFSDKCLDGNGVVKSWHVSHILDFSDLSIGDPICDLIPMHLDVFRGDRRLLKQFLESYKLPLIRRKMEKDSTAVHNKIVRLSYLAMCYCILHEENVLGSIFSLWKELRMAKSWEEVEETVWGDLNNYSDLH